MKLLDKQPTVMQPIIKCAPLLPRHELVSRGAGELISDSERSFWIWTVSILTAAYVIASQALLDISGWSGSAFGFAILLAAAVLSGAVRGVWKVRVGHWIIVPLVFTSYCLLRCFSGIRDMSPFDTFAQTASAFLGGVAIALALRIGVSFKSLVHAQLAANLLQIVIVLCGIGSAPVSEQGEFRFAGLTGNPNLLALQLSLGACLIWLAPRSAGLVPCVLAAGSVAFALAVTGSRKAVLFAFFFLILMLIQIVFLVPPKFRRLAAVLAVATPCLVGLAVGPWLYEHGREIEAIQRTVDYQDSSFQMRTDMIRQGIRLWSQAPVFGNGLAAFQGLSGEGTYAHNNYVELLCNLGIVGAALYYSLYALVFFRSLHAHQVTRFYCWVFALALLLADVGYVSYKSKQTIMILMILIVATTSHHIRKHRDHSGERGPRSPRHRLRRLLFKT